MDKRYLMGVDIGTYASKGVITTLGGKVIEVRIRPHEPTIPRAGWTEHDAEAVWWGDFVAITRDLLGATWLDPRRIVAIGCSAIGPDLLPIDATGWSSSMGVSYSRMVSSTCEIRRMRWQISDRIYSSS